MKLDLNGFWIGFLILAFCGAIPRTSYAQDEVDIIEYYEYRGKDTVRRSPLTRAQIRLRNIKPTERFDIQLNWGFLLAQSMPDTVPVRTSSSGSRVVSLSLNYLITDRLLIKIQPGFSFYKITFEQSVLKTFPSQADSANKEKLRSEYIDLGFGLAYVLQADASKGKLVSMLEVGVTGGHLLGSSYKLTRNEDGQIVKLKIPGVPDLNPWRTGAYARLSYKFVGIWGFYHLAPVFRAEESSDGIRYPRFARWELGFSIIL